MANYVDGFVLPIPRNHLEEYQGVVKTVAKIWKEHGALAYFEYGGDDLILEGTRSFTELVDAKADEVIVFGWVVFESREARDLANERVTTDPRMNDLLAPNRKKIELQQRFINTLLPVQINYHVNKTTHPTLVH